MRRSERSRRLVLPSTAASHPNFLLGTPGIAENADIALDLVGIAGRLLRVVGQLDGGPAIDLRNLADQ